MPFVILASTTYPLIFKMALVVSSRPNNRDDRIFTHCALILLIDRVDIIDEGLTPIKGKLLVILNFCLKCMMIEFKHCIQKADKGYDGKWEYDTSY